MLLVMDRRRIPEAHMAPVLARLVRSLAMLCLAGGIAVVVHACVWATLCFTEVRQHGLAAVTHPEQVAASTDAPASAPESAGAIVSIKAGTPATTPQSASPTETPEAAAPAADPQSRADSFLGFLTGAATVVGVASLALLPIVLVVAFITSLVRAPRATNASMAGILWALLLFGVVLPWSTFWPQVPWPGLFGSYAALIAETATLKAAGSPFTLGAFMAHVLVPGATIAVLVGIAWRCGEPLHAELMAAESLSFDPEVEQDATVVARKGPTAAMTRSAAGLRLATSGPVPSVGPSSDLDAEPVADERPRRLI